MSFFGLFRSKKMDKRAASFDAFAQRASVGALTKADYAAINVSTREATEDQVWAQCTDSVWDSITRRVE